MWYVISRSCSRLQSAVRTVLTVFRELSSSAILIIPIYKVCFLHLSLESMLIYPLDRFTVTYPPSSLAYLQTVSNAQSLVNSPILSPSYAGLLYFLVNPRNCSDLSIVTYVIPRDVLII